MFQNKSVPDTWVNACNQLEKTLAQQAVNEYSNWLDD